MEREREDFEEDRENVIVVADEDDDDDEEDESVREVLRDRLRLSTISIAQAEAAKNGMDISAQVTACIADLSFKYADTLVTSLLSHRIPLMKTVQLACDLEQFAHHAGRKSVNMEDVLLSTHRNEQLAMSLRPICNEIRTKEAQSQKKKRKKPLSRKEDKQASSISNPHAIAAATKHSNIMPGSSSIQH